MDDRMDRIVETVAIVIYSILCFSLFIGFTVLIVGIIIKNSEAIDNLTDTQVILIFVGALGGVMLVELILGNILRWFKGRNKELKEGDLNE